MRSMEDRKNVNNSTNVLRAPFRLMAITIVTAFIVAGIAPSASYAQPGNRRAGTSQSQAKNQLSGDFILGVRKL